MICTYGNALFAKMGREQSQHRYTAQKMRTGMVLFGCQGDRQKCQRS